MRYWTGIAVVVLFAATGALLVLSFDDAEAPHDSQSARPAANARAALTPVEPENETATASPPRGSPAAGVDTEPAPRRAAPTRIDGVDEVPGTEDDSELDVHVDAPVARAARIHVDVRGGKRADVRDKLQVYLEINDDKIVDLDLRGAVATGQADPGDYDLVVGFGRTYDHSRITRKPIRLRAGDNHVYIDVPVLHAVDLSGPIEERIWYARLDGIATGYGEFGEDTLIRFTGVPAGHYVIRGESGSMVVRVPTTGTIAFRPRKENAIWVNVEHGPRWLKKSPVKTGDIIVGVGGSRFADTTALLQALEGTGGTTLNVIRHGRSLDLRIRYDDKDEDVLGEGIPYPY